MKKLGLALGGGGLKGLAHIGVLQILQDNQIPVAYISGTSAGSIIAALYASGVSPYEMQRIVLNLQPGDYLDYNITGIIKYFISMITPGDNVKLDGLIKGNRLEKLIFYLTDGKSLAETKMPLGIIACDIDSGKEIIFSNQDLKIKSTDSALVNTALLSQAVRASTAIPATFVPYQFMGMQLVDGGVVDIVPVAVQKSMGADYILAINLGQETYEDKVAGIHQVISRSLDILEYKTSDTSEEIYADMIIFPGVNAVGLNDMKEAETIIRMGRRAMRENIELLMKGLER